MSSIKSDQRIRPVDVSAAEGFTLVELMVAAVVMAMLGLALMRVMVSDSRFVSEQSALISTHETARAATYTMARELRMVGDGAVLAASADSIMVRVPYAFGMTCQGGSSDLMASLMPTDSLSYASAVPEGMAWRTDSGTYVMVGGIKVSFTSDSTPCTADSVRYLPGGTIIKIDDVVSPPPTGQIFYLYQTVTYRFSDSAELPGRLGLWRKAGAGRYEELVAPFDVAAGFACLVGADLQVETCPPVSGLDAVRGFELRLVSSSEFAPQGSTAPQTFALTTQVLFQNKVD